MNFIKKIFCRRKQFKPQPKQLRIDGVKTTLTPTPDDAELAAQALLESRLSPSLSLRGRGVNSKAAKNTGKKASAPSLTGRAGGESPVHDAQYYQELSEKIKESHEHDARMATRYVAYVEKQLSTPLAHREGQGESSIATLEHGLFKHQDTVEREGGELLKRWQKCLAECLVRQMVHDEEESPAEGAENTDNTNTDSKE